MYTERDGSRYVFTRAIDSASIALHGTARRGAHLASGPVHTTGPDVLKRNSHQEDGCIPSRTALC